MPYDALNFDQRGTTGPSGKESLTIAEAAVQLTREGLSWSSGLGQGTTVTYAFRSTEPSSYLEGTGGFQRLDAQQIANVERALAQWAGVANIRFERVGAGSSGDGAYSDGATILFAGYTTGLDDATAFAALPGNRAASSAAGDVWINMRDENNLGTQYENSYGFATLIHEIGHAIGLAHPSEYDAVEGGEFSYDANADYQEDSEQYTAMSYFNLRDSGGMTNQVGAAPAGPQIDDIAAIQRLYGANTSHNGGGTLYGFTLGPSFGGNDGYPFPVERYLSLPDTTGQVYGTIWDTGGDDTLNFMHYAGAQKIDLRAGAFSNVLGATGSLSIAQGVVIENAYGGSGFDTLVGNAVDNILSGGFGYDRAVIAATAGSVSFTVGLTPGSPGDVLIASNQGRDDLRSVEIVQFTDQDVRLGYLNDISGQYATYAGRGAVTSEFVFWAGRINTASQLAELRSALVGDPATRAYLAAQIDGTYRTFYNRAAGASEIDYWLGAFTGGETPAAVRAAVLGDGGAAAAIAGAVNAMYEEHIGRVAGAEEIGFWSGQVRLGVGYGAIRSALVSDPSGRAHTDAVVTELYRDYLGRDPGTAELGFWGTEVRNGTEFAGVQAALVADPSGQARVRAVVADIYGEYGGRAATGGELAVWTDLIRAGADYDAVRAAIMDDGLGRAHAAATVSALYGEYLGRTPSVGEVEVWRGLLRAGADYDTLRSTLLSDAGSDATGTARLFGTAGADQFVFAGTGNAVVRGFDPALDTLRISRSLLDGGDALRNAREVYELDGSPDVIVQLNDGRELLIKDTALASLSASDFILT